MTMSLTHRATNRPLVLTLWSLTLFALIPFPHLGLVLLGAAANLAANWIALYLLVSRCKTDRVHGFVRLALQVAILVLGAIVIARSGITIDGFLHFFSHGMK